MEITNVIRTKARLFRQLEKKFDTDLNINVNDILLMDILIKDDEVKDCLEYQLGLLRANHGICS